MEGDKVTTRGEYLRGGMVILGRLLFPCCVIIIIIIIVIIIVVTVYCRILVYLLTGPEN